MESSDYLNSGTVSGSLIGYLIFAFFLGKVLQKGGFPLWHGFVPILNLFSLLKMVGLAPWVIVLYLIPIVNVAVHIVVAIRLGKGFGKSTFYSVVLLWLFTLIGYIMIGFGYEEYDKSKVIATS